MFRAVFGRAEFLGDQETALAVQLLLEGREKHALPYRTLRSAPEIRDVPYATPLSPKSCKWDSMGSDGPQWD